MTKIKSNDYSEVQSQQRTPNVHEKNARLSFYTDLKF